LARIRALVAAKLRPRVRDIDDGTYPENLPRDLGAAGAFAPLHADAADLTTAIEAIAIAGNCAKSISSPSSRRRRSICARISPVSPSRNDAGLGIRSSGPSVVHSR
jgi:hypothetical protein